MAGGDQVKVHGFWASQFSARVIWALKLKDVDFDFIEEELPHRKSHRLLNYNPVHKKVPVLLHAGRPISESLVILEYIEETWPDPPLLPRDPHQRAAARFWIKFAEDKSSAFYGIHKEGEEKERAIEEARQMLRILEEEALGAKKYFGGENINMVDICCGWLALWGGCAAEVAGVSLFDPNKLPCLCRWIHNFRQIPEIKDNLPDAQNLLSHMRRWKDKIAMATPQM